MNETRKLKLPKTRKEWQARLDQERHDGYSEGFRAGAHRSDEEIKRLKDQSTSRQHRIDALKALTAYCSVTGQTIGEFAKAMASEGDQL